MDKLIETMLEYAEWAESNIWEVPITLPDVLREAVEKLKALTSTCKDLRNELCLKCGKHHKAHLGACDGCRWELSKMDFCGV